MEKLPNFINLKIRNETQQKLRHFFQQKNYLEVDTPLISNFPSIDLHIEPFTTFYQNSEESFLQTSPEFAMKRLLSLGSGSIFQICKAFRNGEFGQIHNPEFTIVEWYKVGANHFELMAEISELFESEFGFPKAKLRSYQNIFETFLEINPFEINFDSLKDFTQSKVRNLPELNSKDDFLNLLLTEFIEPKLGFQQPEFIYDYPESQAALAKIENGKAQRFELYIKGTEICNGFNELTDENEQKNRFIQENEKRFKAKKRELPIDYRFLEALKTMPECSGVAMGFDRLVMLLTQSSSIKQVITFDFPNA
ncbi:MAG: EF-P lysine aminoacylase GenX [Calditrichaeota bacterium]|nr:MAG: EF-P lysine aminoacylase GenX [Calditrichota bacterium]